MKNFVILYGGGKLRNKKSQEESKTVQNVACKLLLAKMVIKNFEINI